MKKSKKKLLAMILAFTMVFGTLPSNVFANNEQEQIHAEIEETVTTDVSENVENENPVEDITEETQEEVNTEEEALPEENADNEVAVDSSLDKIKLEKTEEVIAGEKYIIVYDNKQALSVGKDQVISVPVEIEGEIVKTEITKNMVWTVDDNNNLVSELGKKLSAELTLLEDNGQSFKFNKKNVSYENGEVNNYLTYNEENNKWSLNTEENEAVTYYNVVGAVEILEELTKEGLDKIEEANKPTESVETPEESEDTATETPSENEYEQSLETDDEDAADVEEDNPTIYANGDLYRRDTNGIDSGSQYLIVVESEGNYYALDNSLQAIQVTLNNGKIVGTDNDSYLLWQFSKSNSNYTIKNNNKYLSFRNNRQWTLNTSSNSNNLTVSMDAKSYGYRISYTANGTTRYLNYNNNNNNNNRWNTGTSDSYSIQLYRKDVTETPVESIHFPVTMYNYYQTSINTISKNIVKPGADKTFLFNDQEIIINSNNDSYVTQGILKNTIENGTISFSDTIKGADIFGQDEIVGAKDVYKNVQFPFLYQDGYYEFNSANYHTHLDTTDKDGQTLNLYSGAQNVGGKGTFFPFNAEGESLQDYYFGMNMSVNFFMTQDGKIKDTDVPIQFEFSGDDDVWVFINNTLVLDLGGIHGIQQGNINFATRKVTYTGSRRDINGNNIASGDTGTIVNFSDIFGESQLSNLYDSEQEHTLQILYLERGANISNCKIKFNLPQKDRLEITKQLGEKTPIIKEQKFKFKVEKSTDATNYSKFAGEKYNVYYNGSKIRDGVTTEDGTFELYAYETAIFKDPDTGYYKITEVDLVGDYTTTWATQKIGDSSTIQNSSNTISPAINIVQQTGTEKKLNRYEAICTNSSDKLLLTPDTVVIDYGKPISINITSNDNKANIQGYAVTTIKTVRKINDSDTNGTIISDDFDSGLNLPLKNGFLTRKSDDEVLYTPTDYMDEIENATYTVSYSTGIGETVSTATTESTIKIIPATTVYYEDNFGVTVDSERKVTSSTGIQFSGTWIQEGNSNGGNQDNGLVNGNEENKEGQSAGLPYGYDNSYANDSKFSNGSAMKITGNDTNTKASFKFKGTGFDIISRTDNETGIIGLLVYELDTSGNRVKEDGKDKIIKEQYLNTYYQGDETSKNGLLYQIPVFNWQNKQNNKLKFGYYEVEIIVGKDQTFYLDAIRLYNPLGIKSGDTNYFDEANLQYIRDGEANAIIREVRNILIGNNSFKLESSSANGIVYIDGKSGNDAISIETYKEIGPNNEVYLKNENAIAFKLDGINSRDKVQIGLKSADGNVVKAKVNNKELDTINTTNTINTSTDMYYDITDYIGSNGIVVITNLSDSILSITNLKITSTTAGRVINILSDEETIITANMLAYEAIIDKSADINNSGTVDILDLANVANNQGKEIIIGVSTDIYKQDLTASRNINMDDLYIVRDNLE